jgi:hypothetical protein
VEGTEKNIATNEEFKMAKVTLLKNRSEIKSTNEVRWDQDGVPRRSKIKASNHSNIFLLPDLEVSVFYPYFDASNKLKNELKRRDQNPLPDHDGNLAWVDWTGNFQPEEALLWTGNQDIHDGPLKIIFRPSNGKTVKAVGLQLQPACPGKFTAVLDVYDTAGHFLDELTCKGTSITLFDAARPENNAPFVGVRGDDISRIELSTRNVCAGGFCINQLSVEY